MGPGVLQDCYNMVCYHNMAFHLFPHFKFSHTEDMQTYQKRYKIMRTHRHQNIIVTCYHNQYYRNSHENSEGYLSNVAFPTACDRYPGLTSTI